MSSVELLFSQQGAFSDKNDQLRALLLKLDVIDSDAAVSTLTAEDITLLRRQLVEGQSIIRDSGEKLRQTQEEYDMVSRRRDEIESRLASLETEYEELLGKSYLYTFHPHPS